MTVVESGGTEMRARRGMRAWTWMLVAWAMALTIAGTAWAGEIPVGEVLYHQSFGDTDAPYKAGVRMGTATTGNAWIDVENDALDLHTADDRRAYVLLPDTTWTDSHTIEFSFHFTDVSASNGYLAFLLTCWGEEPSNISAAIFRANGTIDDFDDPDADIQKSIQSGETVYVQIPVENGLVHSIILTAGDTTCTVQRDSILRIAEGQRGFGFRNASVAVDAITIVNGTGYTAKTGAFANMSWSDSDLAKETIDHAPPTGESAAIPMLLLCSVAGMAWAKRQKKHG